jgi:hypothetical protein
VETVELTQAGAANDADVNGLCQMILSNVSWRVDAGDRAWTKQDLLSKVVGRSDILMMLLCGGGGVG